MAWITGIIRQIRTCLTHLTDFSDLTGPHFFLGFCQNKTSIFLGHIWGTRSQYFPTLCYTKKQKCSEALSEHRPRTSTHVLFSPWRTCRCVQRNGRVTKTNHGLLALWLRSHPSRTRGKPQNPNHRSASSYLVDWSAGYVVWIGGFPSTLYKEQGYNQSKPRKLGINVDPILINPVYLGVPWLSGESDHFWRGRPPYLQTGVDSYGVNST